MFQEMKYVFEVYRQGSFTKAAEKLYISQPSLSIMVKKAENRVGTPIFDRSMNPIGLTDAGRAYIDAARKIMEIDANFHESVNRLKDCLTGSISIGGTTLFTSYVLPPLINRFSAEYPGIDFLIHESTSIQLMKEIRNGDLDIAIDNSEIQSSDLESTLFREEEILLAVPRSSAINRQLSEFALSAEDIIEGTQMTHKKIDLDIMKEEPFLLLKTNNDTRIRANAMFRESGINPTVKLELDQQLTAYHLAAYGMGVTFISDTLVKNAVPDPRLLFYRLISPYSERGIFFYCKKNRNLPQAVKAFQKKYTLSDEGIRYQSLT